MMENKMRIKPGDIIRSPWFGEANLEVLMVMPVPEKEEGQIRVMAREEGLEKIDWYLMPEDSITIVFSAEIPATDTSRRAVLEALMDVLHQATGGRDDGTSAYEDAFDLLKELGLVELKEGEYQFLFANLEYIT